MRLYLDTSAYNRPFDDQSQVKIFLETQAVLLILQLIQDHQLELVSSNVLEYENSRNSDSERAKSVDVYLSLATFRQIATESIRQRAQALEKTGVKAIDALHVACAEATQSDYLITCDQRLINRCKTLNLRVINPADFILEMDDEN
ncbi:PIN domain-containing protein [Laspinema olomoucense]|uniref:PIN domain-containing protein n=1 Tax=Laspinema olomoucense D3b TaxID=2953688 RepID=A0ABT2N7Q0_9CYAN|nr:MULTISPECIES: PIN domain-containing protein [unclassified Laspinema]MCT7973172.1 PIN domain-containing protein [Laspinema sp. D3d]MCT7978715.1 PIN domain-containing protein [Laspinema sp. D3b]MCT7990878.1 PIN domain-containing protein [Laspinema sp. D3a]MCT7993192.1 PIN domain-containing protein [Laspinema sp. D3c]